MNDKKNSENAIWPIISGIAGIIFLILVWDMILLDAITKMFLCLLISPFVIMIALGFHNFLYYFNKGLIGWKATAATIAVFLIIPIIMDNIYEHSANRYLVSYPFDGVVAVKIECDEEYIGGSGSVGNEWSYIHLLNGTPFSSGEIVELCVSEPFTITSRIIERDGISDVGETTSDRIAYSNNQNWRRNLNFYNVVHVDEQGGRKNAGAYADFRVSYTLTRTFPDSINYWNLFLNSQSGNKEWIPVTLIICEFACLIIIFYVIIRGTKKMNYEKEKRAQELIQAKQAEKESFLNYLGGKTIREVANVPQNITFINGLPCDNIGNQEYGSYTVYLTHSGSCYHEKKGCCSAHIPVHAFQVQERYRPCSKCCSQFSSHISVPQWYIYYTSLKNKCAYFGIDVVE